MLQALDNLLGNAIKFTPSGGAVMLAVAPVRDGVRFEVSDTGPGVAPDEQPHLFRPFWQARRVDRRGVGLGLSIVKGIVDAHGGDIEVDSDGRTGTKIRFTIPARARARRAPHRGRAARAPRADANVGDRMTRTGAARAAMQQPSADVIDARVRDPARVAALRALSLHDGRADAAFDRLTRLATRFLGASAALVNLIECDRQVTRSTHGDPARFQREDEAPLADSICRIAVATGAPLVIPDTTRDAARRELSRASPGESPRTSACPWCSVRGTASAPSAWWTTCRAHGRTRSCRCSTTWRRRPRPSWS